MKNTKLEFMYVMALQAISRYNTYSEKTVQITGCVIVVNAFIHGVAIYRVKYSRKVNTSSVQHRRMISLIRYMKSLLSDFTHSKRTFTLLFYR